MLPNRPLISSSTSGRLWLEKLGDHGARLDQRDAHVALGDLLAKRLGEGTDAELGRVVDGATLAGAAAGDGGDVDHVGDQPRPLVGALDQVRERRLGDVEETLDVEVDHPLPFLDVGIEGRAEQHQAGVVDDGVEAAELGDRALDQGLGGGAVGDVGLDRERLAAGVVDFLDQFLQSVVATGGDGDGRAVGGEPLRGRLADAAGSAGYEGYGA